jgi:phosphatidylserine decarboxylase
MKDTLIISLLSILPKNQIARWMGLSARIRLPRILHKALITWYVWKYNVNLEESAGKLEDFDSLSDFFLRPLKEGVRDIDQRQNVWISPVDGTVHKFGRIEDGQFLQGFGNKGDIYKLLDLRKDNAFQGGSYAILYLSPKDYHRVHTPLDVSVAQLKYSPGTLWPVFPAATRKISGLFEKNERLSFLLNSTLGDVWMIMVGAFGVGRMTTSVHSTITNTNSPAEKTDFSPPPTLKRNEEIGRFELGSTVILVWPPSEKEQIWLIEESQPIKLGQPILEIKSMQ